MIHSEVTLHPWQPTLIGASLLLQPLIEEDFEPLFEAASDPLIWEQHPDRERYTRERFTAYFRSGIDSRGAFAVIDQSTGQIIGSSRYADHRVDSSSIEIGYTFLKREYWGGRANQEMKNLMLNHAFRFVNDVYFVVGKLNLRSQKALSKLGAAKMQDLDAIPLSGDLSQSVVFKIGSKDWTARYS